MIDDTETDDELASRLGRTLARIDPVPTEVIAAARASRTWRTIDAELAALLYDSALDGSEGVGVRGGGPRLLTFTSPEVTVELEVRDGGHRVVGQIAGTPGARVEICHADGPAPVEIDDIGHFSCRSVGPGPISVRVTDANGTVTQTEWVVI